VTGTAPGRVNLPEGRVRTRTLLQMEMTECGAACLGIILAHYGRIVPLAELRRACGVSRDGSKASNMVYAARSYGLVAKGFRKDIHELTDVAYPYIAFWSFNHFVVVEGCRRGRVFLNDPATGPRTVSLDEFDAAFTGVVLTMQPGEGFAKGGRAPGAVDGLWRRLRSSAGALALCSVISFLLVLPGLVVPALLMVFVDQVLVQQVASRARPIVAALVAATLIGLVLTSIQLRLLRRLRLKLATTASAAFVSHLLRLPMEFYAQRYSGEIAGRVALNDRIADLLSGRLASAAIDVLMMVFYAVAMLYLDRILAAVAIAFAAAHFLVLRWLARRRVDANRRLGQEYGRLAGAGVAGLQSIRIIKASGLEGQFFSRLAGHYARAVNTHQGLTIANLYVSLLPRLVAALMTMAILVLGGLRVIEGSLSIGMLVAFQTLARSFLLPVNSLLNLTSSIQDLQWAVARLDDVLQNPARSVAPPAPAEHVPLRLQGHVELRDVTFGYNRVEPPLIERLSLTIRPGDRVALVGASGSGKSTISRLVAGLLDPLAGEIRFDGRPRDDIPRGVMSGSLAFVDQDITMFAGTVKDNLTLWDPAIPEARILEACRDAAIHDDIVALPEGYDTPLLEGAVDLSGGQRQRLEIARALCGDPSILILDEATSALDAETERRIDRNLRRRGCACLIVAHRLSTIRDADEIIVLDRGKVVQRGPHERMAAEPGPYSRLLYTSGLAMAEDDVIDERRPA
jgi:NHLM bacteriocin system ABC transporter peptidase/ATP-binding protein